MKIFILLTAMLCLVGCTKKEKVNSVSLTFDELETAVFDCDDLMKNKGLTHNIINRQVTLDPKNSDVVNHALSAYMRLNELGLIDSGQDLKEVSLVCQA